MLRKLLVYIFIFTSLQAQAASVFACERMGQRAAQACCCPEMQMAPAAAQTIISAHSCCELTAVVSAGAPASIARFETLNPDRQPQLTTVATATLPQLRYLSAFREVPPGSLTQFGTLTYLKTLRLRI